jgi:hypothetical protein
MVRLAAANLYKDVKAKEGEEGPEGAGPIIYMRCVTSAGIAVTVAGHGYTPSNDQ